MLDTLWKEHLLQMDHLKEGIGLRGYGQKNPLLEYKREGFDLFAGLIQAINQYTVGNLMRIQIVHEETLARMEEEQREARERELEQAERNARQRPKPKTATGNSSPSSARRKRSAATRRVRAARGRSTRNAAGGRCEVWENPTNLTASP